MSHHAWQRFSDAGFKHYYVEEAGFKYNMMDMQAAIGLHQLARVEESWKRREVIWNRYMRELAELPLRLPALPEADTRHAYHLFQVMVDESMTGISRDAFLDGMTQRQIGVGVHYLSMPEHPYYQRTYGWKAEDFPHAFKAGRETVSLPISPRLTDEDVTDVIEAVKDTLLAMNRLTHTAKSIGRIVRTLFRRIQRKPHGFPSLGCMTFDIDDVQLAKQWFKNPNEWNRLAEVEAYEAAFALWNDSRFAFAFMSGRVALSACLHALRLEEGDEVITPGYTCIVVPNAVRFANLVPVFADIELDTYGLDVSAVERTITPKTRAIIIQHLFGLVCRDYLALVALAKRFDLRIIEDCAHSTGALYQGARVGTMGDLAFYSSEQSKAFNTIVGGVAVTNEPTLAAGLRDYVSQARFPTRGELELILRHGISNYYKFKHPSRWWRGELESLFNPSAFTSTTKEEESGIRPLHYGQRMPAPLAALGINQLKKLDKYNEKRRQCALQWDRWCEQSGHTKPLVIPESVPVFLRYPVLVAPQAKRDTSWANLVLGVQPGLWFTSHTHPVPADLPNCPNASQAIARCINLPTLYE